MKKTNLAKKILISFLMLGLLIMVGCSSGGSADPAKNFIGTWEMTIMEEEGEAMSQEDMALMKSMGMSCTLTLNEDKKASFNLFGEEEEGTWSAKDATSCSVTFDGETINAKLADGKLSLEEDGTKLVFEKSTDSK